MAERSGPGERTLTNEGVALGDPFSFEEVTVSPPAFPAARATALCPWSGKEEANVSTNFHCARLPGGVRRELRASARGAVPGDPGSHLRRRDQLRHRRPVPAPGRDCTLRGRS